MYIKIKCKWSKTTTKIRLFRILAKENWNVKQLKQILTCAEEILKYQHGLKSQFLIVDHIVIIFLDNSIGY